MAKIIIELSDNMLGTDIKCSVPWAELQKRRAARMLAPGSESLAYLALNSIVVATAKRKANLIMPKPVEFKM